MDFYAAVRARNGNMAAADELMWEKEVERLRGLCEGPQEEEMDAARGQRGGVGTSVFSKLKNRFRSL